MANPAPRNKAPAQLRQTYRCCFAVVLTLLLSACGFSLEPGLKAAAEGLSKGSLLQHTEVAAPLPTPVIPADEHHPTPTMISVPQENGARTSERIDPPEPDMPFVPRGSPSTLSLTATPSVMISPAPTQKAAIKNIAATSKPSHSMSSDLLFLAGQSLIRWDHFTHFGIALAEYVIEFSPNASGNLIALLRSRGVTANGADLYDLDLLDLETMQISRLLEETSNIENIALSPDGKWLAYSQPNPGGKALAFPISNPDQITELGSGLDPDPPGSGSEDPQPAWDTPREPGAGGSLLNWSPDSQSILWADQRGIWLADFSSEAETCCSAEQINPGIVTILDPAGKPGEIEAWLSAPLWSPKGRFVLVEVTPKQSNVRWQAVLDVSTRRIIQVIDSYEMLATDASLSWLEDGTLAVARAGDPKRLPAPQGFLAPTVQLWQVVPTHASLLIPGKLFQIETDLLMNQIAEMNHPSAAATEKPSSGDGNPVICFEWLQPMEPGQLLLSARILNTDKDHPADYRPVLFGLDLKNGALTPLAKMTFDAQDILWAPDQSGFLAIGAIDPRTKTTQMSYFSIEADRWFDLSEFGAAVPNSARWLPPARR